MSGGPTRARIVHPAVERALGQAIELGEVGVQVAAYLGSELLVHDWIGYADRESGRPVDASTLFWPFSTSKAIVATALHLQAERGLIDYDERVATYWPEYGAHGKGATTVRDALSHRAGVPQMPEGVTPERLANWEWMTEGIAALTPWFPPGTTGAYHSLTWGWIIGELVRRTDPAQRPFARFIAEELADPLHLDDLHFGVPPSELDRVAPLYGEDPPALPFTKLWAAAMPAAVMPCPAVHNQRVLIEAVLPSTGAITNAWSLARHFALLASGGELDGVRLLSRERLLGLTEVREDPYAIDRTRGVAPAWMGVGGYQLGGNPPISNPIYGTGTKVLGHGGAGGTAAWADLETGLAVAICHNRMFEPEEPNPFLAVATAVREVAREGSSV